MNLVLIIFIWLKHWSQAIWRAVVDACSGSRKGQCTFSLEEHLRWLFLEELSLSVIIGLLDLDLVEFFPERLSTAKVIWDATCMRFMVSAWTFIFRTLHPARGQGANNSFMIIMSWRTELLISYYIVSAQSFWTILFNKLFKTKTKTATPDQIFLEEPLKWIFGKSGMGSMIPDHINPVNPLSLN